MRRPMAPTGKKLPGFVLLLAGLAAPVHLPGQQRRGDPESACKEVGFQAAIRVRGSEVVSRDFDLTCGPSSAASRWVFMGDQRTGLWASRALWPARSMSPPLGGQKRGHVRHRGAQDRIKIRNALRATRCQFSRNTSQKEAHSIALFDVAAGSILPTLATFASVKVLLHTVDSNARLTIRSLCIDPAVTLRSKVRKNEGHSISGVRAT